MQDFSVGLLLLLLLLWDLGLYVSVCTHVYTSAHE